jgi:hypothetical protein
VKLRILSILIALVLLMSFGFTPASACTVCTKTLGYWKTHSVYGPAPYDNTWAQIGSGVGEDTPFFSSGQSYYEVMWTNPKKNAYYILAKQYVAATLNILNGADWLAIYGAMGDADFYLYNNGPDDPLTKEERQQIITIAQIIDNYNNGLIGPGACPD